MEKEFSIRKTRKTKVADSSPPFQMESSQQKDKTISVILFASLFLILAPSIHAEENANMGISLSETEVNIGDIFNATIWLDGIKNIDGFKISLLEWTNGSLEVIDIQAGWWDWLWDPGNFFHSHITNIQAGQKYKTPLNKTACTITFKAVNGGVCFIELVNVAVCSGLDSPLSCTTFGASIAVYPFDDNENNEYNESDDPPPDPVNEPINESEFISEAENDMGDEKSDEPDEGNDYEHPDMHIDVGTPGDPSEYISDDSDTSDGAAFPFFETLSVGIVILCFFIILSIYFFKKRKQVQIKDLPPRVDNAGDAQDIPLDQDDGPIRVIK